MSFKTPLNFCLLKIVQSALFHTMKMNGNHGCQVLTQIYFIASVDLDYSTVYNGVMLFDFFWSLTGCNHHPLE